MPKKKIIKKKSNNSKNIKKRMSKSNNKKCKYGKNILMIFYWAIYLTVTMGLFENYNIVPMTVPYGFIGWALIVELPRVFIGFIISTLFFKNQ